MSAIEPSKFFSNTPTPHTMFNLNELYQALADVPTDDFRCLSSADEIVGQPWTLPYAHILREAFNDFRLDRVLCFDNRPTVYLREDQNRLPINEQAALQKKIWNQGAATICVLFSPGHIDVLSGMVQPHPDVEEPEFALPVDSLTTVADVLDLVNRVRTGRIYEEFPNAFLPDHSVDRTLVKNIVFARAKLIDSGLSVGDAHAMLGRLIFLYFLTERGFIPNEDDPKKGKVSCYPKGIANPKELFAELPASKVQAFLYHDLYPKLNHDYNGSMFDAALADEARLLTDERIGILNSFFRGDTLETGQMALPFEIYDFKYIPVETISSLYEEFLKLESPSAKRKQGAYYTPKNLAEMVAEVALGGQVPSPDLRVLDPACGSGIFLVVLFNILAEIAIKRSPNAPKQKRTKAKKLMELMVRQIRGVDVNETACRVTVFSLYLAYFEKLAPADVDDYRSYTNEPVLRSLMSTDGIGGEDYVIRQQDFFACDAADLGDFDLVIGNPPWIGRNDLSKDQKQVVMDWATKVQRAAYADCLPKSKTKLSDVVLRQSQITQAFMWKVPLHLKENGRACLLIPSKIFLNDTDTFQAHWLRRFKVEKALMLTDYRRILFDQAICPAFVISYFNARPDLEDGRFNYEVPKVNRIEVRPGAVTIEADDVKSIRVKGLLSATRNSGAAAYWKERFWGTPRDWKLLSRLAGLPKLSDITDKRGKLEKPWTSGSGFQPAYSIKRRDGRKPQPLQWSLDDPYVSSRDSRLEMLVYPGGFQKLGEKLKELGAITTHLLYHREEPIFLAPMVLVTNGFSKCGFCNFDVRFQDSLQAIKGPQADAKYLKFLAAYLNTPIAYYFQFHTSSSWGVERDKVSLDEVLQSPFFLPDSPYAEADAESIIDEVASIMDALKCDIEQATLLTDRERLVAEAKRKTDELVYRYFDILPGERALIEDTVGIFIKSATPGSLRSKIPTLEPPTPNQRKTYADWLTRTLNRFSKKEAPRISAQGYFSQELGLHVVTLRQSKKAGAYSESSTEEAFEHQLSRIEANCREEGRRISYRRGVCIFEGTQLHLIKPATLRNWCRTAALNDADAIIGYLQGQHHA